MILYLKILVIGWIYLLLLLCIHLHTCQLVADENKNTGAQNFVKKSQDIYNTLH